MVNFAPENIYLSTKKYFPFCCVDLIILDKKKFLLTRRNIIPDKGLWHLPGGIIHKGESINSAINRIADKELGIKIKIKKYVGVYEDIRRNRHTIIHCFLTHCISGQISLNSESTNYDFFSKPPKNIPKYQINELKHALGK